MRVTYAGGVVCGSKDELRGSVVTRADVGNIGLTTHQLFSTAGEREGVKQRV